MEITVVTLFPEIFDVLNYGVIGRGKQNGLYDFNILNPRDFTKDSYRTVDDYPFGGGVGMVMKIEPIVKAYRKYVQEHNTKPFVILMDPRGVTLDDSLVKELSKQNSLMLICGRYEGIDERVNSIVDLKLSIGNFVLSGGEIPALALIDSITRRIPGVVGKQTSYQEDSYTMGMLDHSHYTRPARFEDMKVPDVLLSGHHEKIAMYRLKERLLSTLMKDPQLLKEYDFSPEELKLLKNLYFELRKILKEKESNA